jgi:hypothetical protein
MTSGSELVLGLAGCFACWGEDLTKTDLPINLKYKNPRMIKID